MSGIGRKRLRANIKSKYRQRTELRNASDVEDAKKFAPRKCQSENYSRKLPFSWNKNDRQKRSNPKAGFSKTNLKTGAPLNPHRSGDVACKSLFFFLLFNQFMRAKNGLKLG
jgi:hypothetical protein